MSSAARKTSGSHLGGCSCLTLDSFCFCFLFGDEEDSPWKIDEP